METAEAPKQERKYMDIEEFVQGGYLQEVNRTFFHPLGLALETKPTPDGGASGRGSRYISGIWDVRDDPEGVVFDEDYIRGPEALAKAQNVEVALRQRSGVRAENLGFVIQKVGESGKKEKGRGKKGGR